MAHLMELREICELMKKSSARILHLEEQLVEEKKISYDIHRHEKERKDQVSLLSHEKDNLSNKVSTLQEDVQYLHEDLDQMVKGATLIANRLRINAQDDNVRLFNELCDSQGIPRVSLDLEVFSDDEPEPAAKGSIPTVNELSPTDEDTETDEDHEKDSREDTGTDEDHKDDAREDA